MYFLYGVLFFLVSAGAFAGLQPDGDVVTQADALKLSAQANEIGSDQSLRNSTTLAMQALIKFSDSDVQGAFSTAYKAYGKFKTSENLDRARKQGLLSKASLGSAESSNLTESEIAFLTSPTSYRRIDSSFLSKGENAKLAAEFEQKTGISGTEFVKMLAAASETKLYVNDPKLAEKVDAEFESFLGKIPNKEFRGKVKSALDLVPSLTRNKVLVEGVQKMIAVMGPATPPMSDSDIALAAARISGKAPLREPAAAPPEKKAEVAPPVEVAVVKEEKKSEPEEDEHVGALLRDEIARADESSAGDTKLNGVFKAVAELENETIFQKVSRKYRLVAPRLARD